MRGRLVLRSRALWDRQPLLVLLLIAGCLNLIAAVYSRGFGMLDDHFSIIEVAYRWGQGSDEWFREGAKPIRSFWYPGFHYSLFQGLDRIGVGDPQAKMLVVRILHAFYALLTVFFGYRISLRLADRRTAGLVGLLLATFWMQPFMNVRNLIEVVCIPPLMAGFYCAMKADAEADNRYWIAAGALLGIAFTIRFQTGFLGAGLGGVLLIRRKWMGAWALGAGFLASTGVLLGLAEWVAYDAPFMSVREYIAGGLSPARSAYPSGPWYQYFGLFLGVLIPPVSILFLAGWLSSWRRHALLFWPTFVYFVFHSYFPNKQERFLLPILPIVLILGFVGWRNYAASSPWWRNRRAASRVLWGWFWCVNTVLLAIATPAYSKRNRVESLSYLRDKDDLTGIIWESHRQNTVSPPMFYLNQDVPVYRISAKESPNEIRAMIDVDGAVIPNYAVLLGSVRLAERTERLENSFSVELVLQTVIDPSLVDRVFHRLNPEHNVNQTTYVFGMLDAVPTLPETRRP